jgi:hypothetical protein
MTGLSFLKGIMIDPNGKSNSEVSLAENYAEEKEICFQIAKEEESGVGTTD